MVKNKLIILMKEFLSPTQNNKKYEQLLPVTQFKFNIIDDPTNSFNTK